MRRMKELLFLPPDDNQKYIFPYRDYNAHEVLPGWRRHYFGRPNRKTWMKKNGEAWIVSSGAEAAPDKDCR